MAAKVTTVQEQDSTGMPVAANAEENLAQENLNDRLHAAARDMFAVSLEQCHIGDALDRHLHFEGTTLVHHPFPALQHVLRPTRVDLSSFRHIRIVAIGKAAQPMLDALLARLPRGLAYRGLCAGPDKPARRNWRVQAFAAGHPTPNEESFEAARAALRMLSRAHADTFVFFLVSGGASSLMEMPLDPNISLEDTIAFHEALVSSGATIHEINIVRKHFSAVKGGRLALAAPEATKLTLQVADVPLRNLDALGSGPTIPDRSTVQECREVLERYCLHDKFPAAVRAFFTASHLEETPGAKVGAKGLRTTGFVGGAGSALRAMLRPGTATRLAVPAGDEGSRNTKLQDPPGFSALSLDTLLSSHDLVNAARDRAQHLGYKVIIDNACDDWPYDAAALYLVRRFVELRQRHPRLCLISSGEVTVRLDRKPGTGGRNQQFALAAALVLAGEARQFSPETHQLAECLLLAEVPIEFGPVCVFSAGTDGCDGNSPVAGAVADATTVARAKALHFDPWESLRTYDACPLFSALGDTVVTGKTGHNLRDLRLILSVPADLPADPYAQDKARLA